MNNCEHFNSNLTFISLHGGILIRCTEVSNNVKDQGSAINIKDNKCSNKLLHSQLYMMLNQQMGLK